MAPNGRNRFARGARWDCVTNAKALPEDTCSLVYQCRLALSTRTVNHFADLLRRHLKAIRSRWRILPPGKIAVIVLAVLRHDQRLADMAGGNDVSESTVRHWRDELIGLLAAQAPRLDRVLKKVAKKGGELVLIDGTLIRTRRRTGKADRRNYSGKHRSHGLHFLALTDENERVIWISAARPGLTHDNTAARHDHILAHLRAAGLGALADLGFRGLDNGIHDPVIVTGYAATRTHKLTPGQKEANRVLAVGRAPVEHGFAHLKNWRILTKLRADPAHATQLLRALLVLTNLEVNRRRMIFSMDSRPRPARVPRGPITPAL
ncbi:MULTISPECIES: transposase family protein [unclassified Streptomyces]|uniref:transposase family protein n=1 Tax=unclassified Streptomyces TaxID=2593676 RepID=UPI00331F6A41